MSTSPVTAMVRIGRLLWSVTFRNDGTAADLRGNEIPRFSLDSMFYTQRAVVHALKLTNDRRCLNVMTFSSVADRLDRSPMSRAYFLDEIVVKMCPTQAEADALLAKIVARYSDAVDEAIAA